jgi:hypothetical protein
VAHFAHLYPWQILSRMAGLRLTCRLMPDRVLDMDRLRSEVLRIVSEYGPVGHFRSDHHDGGWKAIGLVAHEGNPFEDRKKLPYAKTPALQLAPYIESILEDFGTGLGRVRLMELQPGKSIYWHYDRHQTIDGEESVRLHIPVFTNEKVRVQLSHEDVAWKAGEIWYGDFSFPHRLHNAGGENRIHLVMDLDLNDGIRALFPQSFLDQSHRRLQVKPAIQHMVDLYAVGRLPRGQRLRELRKVSRTIVRGRDRPRLAA